METPEHVEVVPVESNALGIMERATIDIQIATAHRFPRNIDKFIERAKKMVAVDMETAESCIYRRPVGKDGDNQTFAEGESIRLAEIVAACYGNIRVSGMVTEMTDTYVKAIGIAHDLESNYAAKAEAMESVVKKDYKKKNGEVVKGKPYDDRMKVVVAKAAQSKAMRDAIFRVVPKSLCKSITNIAREVIAGTERPLEERRKQVQSWLAKLSIEPERVFAVLGVQGISDLGTSELETLTGLRTALKDGDTTLDEAFPPLMFDEKRQAEQKNIDKKAGSETVADPFSQTQQKPEPETQTVPPSNGNGDKKPSWMP
jgi:hypothetical protein